MNKQDIISFFDSLAPQWDADMIRSDEIINLILNAGNVKSGADVLDVACGTGVLFPDYLKRNVGSLTGIDISPEMAKLAREKFPQVQVICGDVEEAQFDQKFDCIMVYNAFPHFSNPERLIRVLASFLKPGGTLTVAHGMSRAQIDHHHEGTASSVSVGLLHEDALAEIFDRYLTVTHKVSDDRMYLVCGKIN